MDIFIFSKTGSEFCFGEKRTVFAMTDLITKPLILPLDALHYASKGAVDTIKNVSTNISDVAKKLLEGTISIGQKGVETGINLTNKGGEAIIDTSRNFTNKAVDTTADTIGAGVKAGAGALRGKGGEYTHSPRGMLASLAKWPGNTIQDGISGVRSTISSTGDLADTLFLGLPRENLSSLSDAGNTAKTEFFRTATEIKTGMDKVHQRAANVLSFSSLRHPIKAVRESVGGVLDGVNLVSRTAVGTVRAFTKGVVLNAAGLATDIIIKNPAKWAGELLGDGANAIQGATGVLLAPLPRSGPGPITAGIPKKAAANDNQPGIAEQAAA